MASQQQPSAPYLNRNDTPSSGQTAGRLYHTRLTSEALQALQSEIQGLRGHSDFLAQQLWRQGQAYHQLAMYCNQIRNEQEASASVLAGVEAVLDATRLALRSERQRHSITQNAHACEAKHRADTERELAKETQKFKDLSFVFSKLDLMKLEDLDVVLNNSPNVSKLFEQDWVAAHGVTEGDKDSRQIAFTLECYKHLFGKLKERHEHLMVYLGKRDTEIRNLREELQQAQPRMAMLWRKRV